MLRGTPVRFTLFFLALGYLASCAEKPTPPVLRVGYASHDHHAALFVAALTPEIFRQQGGLYLKEIVPRKEYKLMEGDAEVAVLQMGSSTGGAELIRKLTEDQFDLAFGGYPAMVKSIDDGAPLRVVAPVMYGGTGLILADELGISSWKDFLQAARRTDASAPVFRIGHQAKGSVQQLALESKLAREDISPPRVSLVDLHGPKNLLPALESKIVEGFVAMQPYLAMAQEGKLGRFVGFLEDFEEEGVAGYYPCCALAARNSVLQRHPDAVRKFLTLMLRANRRLSTHPVEAAKPVAEWLGVRHDVEKLSLPTIHFVYGFDAAWLNGEKHWLEHMRRTGQLKGVVKEAMEAGKAHETIFETSLLVQAIKEL